MKDIKLTNSSKVVLVDDEDYERVNSLSWALTPQGYARRNVYFGIKDSKRILKRLYLHRFLMFAEKGLQVDHINHERLDCRKSNLRVVSPAINMTNQSVPGGHKTGVLGVRLDKSGNWTADISIKNKTKRIGTFQTKELATIARKQAEQKRYESYLVG